MMYTFEELSAADSKVVGKWLAHEAVKRWICIDVWESYFAWTQQNPNYYLFKAKADERMLGIFALEIMGAQGFLWMAIDPTEHNKGYGKLLLKNFLQMSRQLTHSSLTTIVANIFPGNKGSVRCLTACGFAYRSTGEDGEDRYEYMF